MTDMTLWRTYLWTIRVRTKESWALPDVSFHGWVGLAIVDDAVMVQTCIKTFMSRGTDAGIKEQLSILVHGAYDPYRDTSYTYGKHDPWTFRDALLSILRARVIIMDNVTENQLTKDGLVLLVNLHVTTLNHHAMIARALVRGEDHTESEPDYIFPWNLIADDPPYKVVKTMTTHPVWLDDLSAALLSPVLIPDLSP